MTFDLLNATPEQLENEIRVQDGLRKHKFLTKKLKEEFEKVGVQEYIDDPLVIAKWFHPLSGWYWYATEFDPETGNFFGWVKGDFPELGYFNYYELATLNVRGLPIERDCYFDPVPLSKVKAVHSWRLR